MTMTLSPVQTHTTMFVPAEIQKKPSFWEGLFCRSQQQKIPKEELIVTISRNRVNKAIIREGSRNLKGKVTKIADLEKALVTAKKEATKKKILSLLVMAAVIGAFVGLIFLVISCPPMCALVGFASIAVLGSIGYVINSFIEVSCLKDEKKRTNKDLDETTSYLQTDYDRILQWLKTQETLVRAPKEKMDEEIKELEASRPGSLSEINRRNARKRVLEVKSARLEIELQKITIWKRQLEGSKKVADSTKRKG